MRDDLRQLGLHRVVEVWCGTRGVFGSGYAIGADLVLTAGHIVTGSESCEVRRLDSPEWLQAMVLHHSRDVALLRVAAKLWAATPGCGRVRWGCLDGTSRVRCIAAGFPRFQERTPPDHSQHQGAVHDVEVLEAWVMPGTGAKADRYAVDVSSAHPVAANENEVPPTGNPRESSWDGMSGAALLASDELQVLGVVVIDRGFRLEAVPITGLLADPDFAALVGAGPEDIERLPAHRFLRPPYERRPARFTDAQLLKSRYGAVPFIGRAELLTDLLAWCDSEQPFSAAVITGEGGTGKTRLAAELCARMQGSGWHAGIVDTQAIPGSPQLTVDSLLVFDYAENVSGLVEQTLGQLAQRAAGPRVRVLLLARHAWDTSSWWQQLADATDNTVTEFVDLRIHLAEHPLGPAQQRQHAEQAARAFAERLGVDEYQAPDVSGEELTHPLMIHIAALLAVRGNDIDDTRAGRSRESVLRQLLGRERTGWEQRLAAHKLGHLHPTHAQRAIILAVLAGPAYAGEMADLLAALPEYTTDPNLRSKVAEWLRDVYPDTSVGPDALVERLLGDSGDGLAGLVRAIAASPACQDTHLARMLDTLRMAAALERAPGHALSLLLTSKLQDLVDRALASSDTRLPEAVNAAVGFCWVSRLDPTELVLACLELQPSDPRAHPAATGLLTGLAYLAARGTGAVASRIPQARPNYIEALIRLALSQISEGRHDLAAGNAKMALEVCGDLADASPRDRTYLYARTRGLLCVVYCQLGRYDDAVDAGRHAVAGFRELAAKEPDYRDQLADALSALGSAHNRLGNLTEGVAAITGADRIYQELRKADRDRYNDRYAHRHGAVLHNLAASHEESGRYIRALEYYNQADAIFRRLFASNPGGYRTDLAEGLRSIGECYLRLGAQHEDRGEPDQARDAREHARAATEEAAGLYRQLARYQPAHYGPELVRALSSLFSYYLHAGQPADALKNNDEAIQAITEGLKIEATPQLFHAAASYVQDMIALCTKYWADQAPRNLAYKILDLLADLTKTAPHAFRPTLATSLHNIAYHESQDGDLDQAAGHLEQAVAAWDHVLNDPQDSAAGQVTQMPFPHDPSEMPSAGGPGLTAWQRKDFLQRRLLSVNGLAQTYQAAGRTDDATRASLQIIDSYRDLATVDAAVDPRYLKALACAIIQLAPLALGDEDPYGATLSIRQATDQILKFANDHPDGLTWEDAAWLRPLMRCLHLIGDHSHADSIESLLRRTRHHLAKTPVTSADPLWQPDLPQGNDPRPT